MLSIWASSTITPNELPRAATHTWHRLTQTCNAAARGEEAPPTHSERTLISSPRSPPPSVDDAGTGRPLDSMLPELRLASAVALFPPAARSCYTLPTSIAVATRALPDLAPQLPWMPRSEDVRGLGATAETTTTRARSMLPPSHTSLCSDTSCCTPRLPDQLRMLFLVSSRLVDASCHYASLSSRTISQISKNNQPSRTGDQGPQLKRVVSFPSQRCLSALIPLHAWCVERAKRSTIPGQNIFAMLQHHQCPASTMHWL